MAKWLTLIPAYGRDYTTAEAVLEHWTAGKDFRIADISCRWDGAYTSCRDHDHSKEYGTFKIRYGTILNTGFILPNFALIRLVDGKWTLVDKSDGTEGEDITEEG